MSYRREILKAINGVTYLGTLKLNYSGISYLWATAERKVNRVNLRWSKEDVNIYVVADQRTKQDIHLRAIRARG